MPDTMANYYVAEVSRLVELVKTDERMLKARQRLLPGSESKVKQRLSFLRKHISGMCQIARKAGATEGMIDAALMGKEK